MDPRASDLLDLLRRNPFFAPILDDLPVIEPMGLCLAAGGVCQTVWNLAAGRDPRQGLVDIDLIYFDAADLTEEGEGQVAARLRHRYRAFGLRIDVKNQARVHLWYPGRFGRVIPPFRDIEDAIAAFPVIAGCVGVMADATSPGQLRVIAPFGLEDLFAGRVRPNKRIATAEIYATKTARWRQEWPALAVLPWA